MTTVAGAAVESPPLFTDGRLVAPQRVNSGLDGLYYIAAYVSGAPGVLAKRPAVWRVIEPGGALPVPELNIAAYNDTARAVTPVTGFASDSGPDTQTQWALRCAEQNKPVQDQLQ